MDQGTVTGTENIAIGRAVLRNLTSGNYNTALGSQALLSNTTASANTAVGYQAGYSNTTGHVNAFGAYALQLNTTGTGNSAFGGDDTAIGGALRLNTTGSYNIAFGTGALYSNTTANNNVAVGYQAGYTNTGTNNTFMGYQAGYTSTDAVIGAANITCSLTVGCDISMVDSTSSTLGNIIKNGSSFIHDYGTNNTFMGYQAGYTSNATGSNTGGNTCIGSQAGYGLTTGSYNTFIGVSNGANGSGYLITTGSKNTILGGFTGNQGGLDIRTASNYIVLSDGDGNPNASCDNAGAWAFGAGTKTNDGLFTLYAASGTNLGPVFIGRTGALNSSTARWYTGSNSWIKGGTAYDAYTVAAGAAASGGVTLTSGATSWVSASDARLKNVTGTYTTALADIAQLQPVKFTWKSDTENKPQVGVLAQSVENIVPEAIDHIRVDKADETEYLGVRYTELIPLMIASIQELNAKVTALEAKLEAK